MDLMTTSRHFISGEAGGESSVSGAKPRTRGPSLHLSSAAWHGEAAGAVFVDEISPRCLSECDDHGGFGTKGGLRDAREETKQPKRASRSAVVRPVQLVICKAWGACPPLNHGVDKPLEISRQTRNGDWLANMPTRRMPQEVQRMPLPACRLKLSNPPSSRQSQPCRLASPHQAGEPSADY
jgi:hypothetical protein